MYRIPAGNHPEILEGWDSVRAIRIAAALLAILALLKGLG